MDRSEILKQASFIYRSYQFELKVLQDPDPVADLFGLIQYAVHHSSLSDWKDRLMNATITTYRADDWFLMYELIHLHTYGINSNYSPVEPHQDNEKYVGGVIHLPTHRIGKWYHDLTEVSFELFYATIMYKKCAQITTPYSNLFEIVEKAVICRKANKSKNASDDTTTPRALKSFINMAYGMFNGNKMIPASRNVQKHIATQGRQILHSALVIFSGHVVYADTDTLFFHNYHEVRDRFREFAASKSMTLIEEENLSGIFLAGKKYLVVQGGKPSKEGRIISSPEYVKMRGIRIG